MDGVDLAHDSLKWQNAVNKVIHFQVPLNEGEFFD